MTITHASSGSSARHAGGSIQWTTVQSGLWVGKSGGEFAGMSESREGGFAAIRLSELLGIYESLAAAKAAFAAA